MKKSVTKGRIVTVGFGPFAGLSGAVLSCSTDRVVVRVTLNGRSIPAELDEDMICVPGTQSPEFPSRSRPV